ncbi:hypothetical protein HYQ46_007401 [Verticillium longisporum]|nr:hypothetical protein HYQ46_007401 [Verticillium longisporum]
MQSLRHGDLVLSDPALPAAKAITAAALGWCREPVALPLLQEGMLKNKLGAQQAQVAVEFAQRPPQLVQPGAGRHDVQYAAECADPQPCGSQLKTYFIIIDRHVTLWKRGHFCEEGYEHAHAAVSK